MELIYNSAMRIKHLLKQFLGIKINLLSGTDLPFGLNENNVQELLSLSESTIYYSDDKIIFTLNIPLVYENEFILFNLIPIPRCQNNSCVFIKPNHNFLATSRSTFSAKLH